MPSDRSPDRLDALWRDHAPAVVRYARRRVMPSEVDEVVAETFVVAWRRIDDVPDYPLPWLLGVARGVSANLRRAARRRDALHERVTAASETARAPDRGIGDDELSEALGAGLARLDEKDRELLMLVAWDGLSQSEAAVAMGCSRGALAVRLHRARRRLRAEVAHRTDEPTAPAVLACLPLTGDPS